jgi:hypothetical protein
MRKEYGPGAPASAAEAGIETRERGLDTKSGLLGQYGRVLQHATPRIISAPAGEQKTTFNVEAFPIEALAPDPVLDAAYRSGIVPPAQRIRTATADVEIVATVFPDRHARSKTEMILSLGWLADLIRTTRAPHNEGLPLLKLAQFGGGRTDPGCVRFDANVVAISGVETDYDGEQVSIEQAIEIATSAGLLCVIYTSPSHAPEKPLSQSYYFGSVGNKTHRVELIEGWPIDLLDSLDRIAIGKPSLGKRTFAKPVKPATGLSPFAEAALDKACRNIITAVAGEQERTLTHQSVI